MPTYTVKIPAQVTSEMSSIHLLNIEFITAISQLKSRYDGIIFDFSKTAWIDAEMTVVLSMMFELALTLSENVSANIENMPDNVKTILQKNNFFPYYNLGVKLIDTYNTTITFFADSPTNDKDISEYIKEEIFTAIKTSISPDFLKQVSYCIFEIIHNVREHSGADRFFICGQYYPKKELLRLAISDLGIGVPSKVKERFPEIKSDISAVDWAFIDGNTTKRRREGGVGLYSIKDLLHERGRLKLISNQAYYSINRNGTVDSNTLSERFRGTLLWIEFDIKKCLKPRKNVKMEENDTFNF